MLKEKFPISKLVPHEKNDYFFDDISGEVWAEFLQSVKTSNIIEPIVITQNNVIVSGHQRVRACKELGIDTIKAEIHNYDSEDKILKDLIETNIRQRGIGNPNPIKFGRCIKELERIYGIREGRPEKKLPNNSEVSKTQPDLAAELGISVDTLNNYKHLAEAIPEIQSLVESGRVTKSVALSLVKKLSEDEQREIAENLPDDDGKISKRQMDFYIKRVKELTDENTALTEEKASLKEQLYKPVTIEDLTADEIENIKKSLSIEGVESSSTDTEQKLEELQCNYDDLLAKYKESQYSADAQEAHLAYEFSKATSTLIANFTQELLYSDFFDNNVGNNCEERVISAAASLAEFCRHILAKTNSNSAIIIDIN